MIHYFLQKKTVLTVSHEIITNMISSIKTSSWTHYKKLKKLTIVHDIKLGQNISFEQLEFDQYGEDFKKTDGSKPMFLTTANLLHLKQLNL